MSFQIITDTGSDLHWDMVKDLGLVCLPLPILMDGKPYRDIFETEAQIKEFYRLIRDEKRVATTSRMSLIDLEKAARKILDGGEDVLFIGFSSGLSASTPACIEFLETLKPEYPDRKIIAIDSLAPSGGFALLLYYCVMHKRAGESIDEVAKFAYDTRLHVAHWFTVDDLMFLHRGGRVGKASAIAGTALGIKPVLHVDDEGHLIMMEKAKSRRKSLRALFSHVQQSAIQPVSEQTIFINHGDCIDDAKILGGMLHDELGCEDITYLYTTPVVGAHSGPGTISVFFLADKR